MQKGVKLERGELVWVECVCWTVVMLFCKKTDGVINVKVEFGEGEDKVPFDNIVKRIEVCKSKERVTYKMIKEYIEEKNCLKVHITNIALVKQDLGLLINACTLCGGRIETANGGESGSNKGCFKII